MFRLYSNENFPLPVVEELRRLGCDVTTVLDTGRAGQAWPDEAVLQYAAEEGRVLLTMNRKDFFRLHREQIPHAGIVACTMDADFPNQARRIYAHRSRRVKCTDKSSALIDRPAEGSSARPKALHTLSPSTFPPRRDK